MSEFKIEDLRFSSSAIDDFFVTDRPKTHIANGKVRIASLHTLSGFQVLSSDTLIRTSQQDFWKLGQDQEGYFIERLVDDGDGPVKG